ncbi:DUF5671 domain-containing protein [Celeribacter halophilus]|uniref:DUF5671 domain-containing protein n=1 Tax=Celeribacter halophilus TaxID=576117 RepID=A0A1I3VQL9_9RHOB|nr:DUF5671 domain-containing protein [Celeribacter halophilus]PZX08418.1 hypothetical protein LX82_03205 [Celeribacter halophilus]SFJ97452.1 hypothetical protein SAMN04488138_1179 [Celeribacter halophilus]
MSPIDQLAQFTREALLAGQSRDEIATALREAGWAETEVQDALGAWAETDHIPPVPRPRPYVSAKESFFYALMFVALAMTTWHIASIGMELVERLFDEGHAYMLNRSLRWSIAAIIVFFPLFMFLQRNEARTLRQDESRRRSVVRKWFGYIALFVSSMALLGDLLSVIYALLNGDLSLVFALKLAVVGAVAGTIFGYYRNAMKDAENDL